MIARRPILLHLLLLLCSTSILGQNIDWNKAPINPLPNGSNLSLTNLKGDVFQANYSFYDKEGNWLSFYPKERVTKDHLNRVISYTDKYGSTTTYSYDASGNLVNESGNIYEYDAQNRIIKGIFHNKIETHSYQQQDDITIVVTVTSLKSGLETLRSESHYKKGLLIERRTSKTEEPQLFKYLYDLKGNWTERTLRDSEDRIIGTPFNREMIYHSEHNDIVKNGTVIKTTDNLNLKGGIATPHLYINDKKVRSSLYNKFGNDYIFYDPISSTYYIAPYAYDFSIGSNSPIPFKPLIKAKDILLLKGDKNALLIKEGLNYIHYEIPYDLKYQKFYNHILISNEQETYFSENVTQSANVVTTAYPVVSMTSEGNDIWYVPNRDKLNVTLFDKGNLIEGFSVSGYLSGTKDFVLALNNTPTYVLSNFSAANPEQFHKGRLFNPAVDRVESNNSTTPKKNDVADSSCTSGNCTDGYGTYTFESGTQLEGFFKNGKLNGYAQYTYANGDTFSGNFHEGKRDGYGIYHWKQNNLYYYGHWKDTKQHGYGYFVKNGSTVEAGIYTDSQLTTNLLTDYLNKKTNGNCLGNCTDGYGSITYNQGDVYEGFFKNGQPYKAGSYMWTSGKSYMGDWDDSGKINYTGQFFTEAFVYKGAFAHNGYLTGLGVKLDKKTNVKTYGEFKAGTLMVDYAN
ncbi:hypothetical protein AB9K26_05795 [Psychroserpens sp. XS_ASV72]|uniref:hypothetical protein n=1 Tax=Psychroserpens sp. XS_ASV72 TaxID=3241293 RepID=UPI003514894F